MKGHDSRQSTIPAEARIEKRFCASGLRSPEGLREPQRFACLVLNGEAIRNESQILPVRVRTCAEIVNRTPFRSVTKRGDVASVRPQGCATKRPVDDISEGVTSAQNVVRASSLWAKHESLP